MCTIRNNQHRIIFEIINDHRRNEDQVLDRLTSATLSVGHSLWPIDYGTICNLLDKHDVHDFIFLGIAIRNNSSNDVTCPLMPCENKRGHVFCGFL